MRSIKHVELVTTIIRTRAIIRYGAWRVEAQIQHPDLGLIWVILLSWVYMSPTAMWEAVRSMVGKEVLLNSETLSLICIRERH